MQQYTIALQIPRGPPRKSHTVKRKTAGSIGLSLTLPKFYLATCNGATLSFFCYSLIFHNIGIQMDIGMYIQTVTRQPNCFRSMGYQIF